jgi:hypothetical protein
MMMTVGTVSVGVRRRFGAAVVVLVAVIVIAIVIAIVAAPRAHESGKRGSAQTCDRKT